MKTKLANIWFPVIQVSLLVVFVLFGGISLFAETNQVAQKGRTNSVQQSSATVTNGIPVPPGLDGRGQSQAVEPSSVPRLQKRKGPDLPPQRLISPLEEERLRHNAPWRELQPSRFAGGATNGPATNRAARFTPRPALQGEPRAGQSQITSRRAPPSVLKKYDRDKNGLLDPVEWYQYRQEVEQRHGEIVRLRTGTNMPSSVVSTNTPNP